MLSEKTAELAQEIYGMVTDEMIIRCGEGLPLFSHKVELDRETDSLIITDKNAKKYLIQISEI